MVDGISLDVAAQQSSSSINDTTPSGGAGTFVFTTTDAVRLAVDDPVLFSDEANNAMASGLGGAPTSDSGQLSETYSRFGVASGRTADVTTYSASEFSADVDGRSVDQMSVDRMSLQTNLSLIPMASSNAQGTDEPVETMAAATSTTLAVEPPLPPTAQATPLGTGDAGAQAALAMLSSRSGKPVSEIDTLSEMIHLTPAS